MPEAAAGGAVGSFINGFYGLINTILSNDLAGRRESIARRENYGFNEMAAENADTRTRALYNDLYSPEAQMKYLKAAGLSPSIYSGGGMGISGQTGAQGAGAGGISPNVFGMPNIDFAQAAQLMSQARLNNAKADEYTGNNEMGAAKIKNLLAQSKLYVAEEHYKEAETTMQTLENWKLEDTYNEQVQIVIANAEEAAWNAKKAYIQAEHAGILKNFDAETFDSKTAQELNKANLLFWQSQNAEKNLGLTQAEINKLSQETYAIGQKVLQDWKQTNGQIDFWTKEAHTHMREIEKGYTDIYSKFVTESRKETNRSFEKGRELDIKSMTALIQAIGFYFGMQARGEALEAQDAKRAAEKKAEESKEFGKKFGWPY